MAAPITDLDSLKAAVLDYLDRPDLADGITTFVALAEARFAGALRAREMEKEASLAGPAAIMALPSDFLEWIGLSWTAAGRTARPTFAEADSPEARFRHRPAGDPQFFTVLAGQVRMVPPRDGAITLFYYSALPALGGSTTTNWLLARAPDAYLYATLAEAYLYLKNPDAAQAHLQLAMQSLTAVGLKADTQKLAKRAARPVEVDAAAQAVRRPE